ncbi:receptor-like serine/threonine-protein kinase SD1-7 [Miscanthus floridulus]|uniref:receptor-like serine/threonine-protein kinase SD1-7 n=1 Tax=Miscanthus floridulus TaxID=154761 RepID=UPI00345AD574
MFCHSRAAPKVMSLETLKEITNNFSIDRKLGSGTFGIVYKGVQDGEEIAVKQLQTQGHDDEEEFMKEFENLWRLRHPNVVQLLGYCYEIKREVVALGDGRFVLADNIYRALCFEYMHNGSLRKHLYDEYHGHDWQTRFKIIKGTCEGLKYLHEGLERPMYHLDLKPENILLDKNMVPKLADFGLSKLVHNNQTQVTQSCIGTRGYLPPEYIEDNLVSNKLDIFSLGVVYTNWRDRLKGMLSCTSLEAECHQVKGCIEIAINCIDADRQKRPTIGEVVCRLNELEHVIDMSAAPCQLQQISATVGPGESSSELLKDMSIKEGSNSSSNISGLSMDCYPQNRPVTQQSEGTVFNRKLSMHQIFDGPDYMI